MAYDTDLLNIFIYAFFVLAGVSALLAVAAVAWLMSTRETASTGTARIRRSYRRRSETPQAA
jgi:hypothetical protein